MSILNKLSYMNHEQFAWVESLTHYKPAYNSNYQDSDKQWLIVKRIKSQWMFVLTTGTVLSSSVYTE